MSSPFRFRFCDPFEFVSWKHVKNSSPFFYAFYSNNYLDISNQSFKHYIQSISSSFPISITKLSGYRSLFYCHYLHTTVIIKQEISTSNFIFDYLSFNFCLLLN